MRSVVPLLVLSVTLAGTRDLVGGPPPAPLPPMRTEPAKAPSPSLAPLSPFPGLYPHGNHFFANTGPDQWGVFPKKSGAGTQHGGQCIGTGSGGVLYFHGPTVTDGFHPHFGSPTPIPDPKQCDTTTRPLFNFGDAISSQIGAVAYFATPKALYRGSSTDEWTRIAPIDGTPSLHPSPPGGPLFLALQTNNRLALLTVGETVTPHFSATGIGVAGVGYMGDLFFLIDSDKKGKPFYRAVNSETGANHRTFSDEILPNGFGLGAIHVLNRDYDLAIFIPTLNKTQLLRTNLHQPLQRIEPGEVIHFQTQPNPVDGVLGYIKNSAGIFAFTPSGYRGPLPYNEDFERPEIVFANSFLDDKFLFYLLGDKIVAMDLKSGAKGS